MNAHIIELQAFCVVLGFGALCGFCIGYLLASRPRRLPMTPHREPPERNDSPPEYQYIDWEKLLRESGRHD